MKTCFIICDGLLGCLVNIFQFSDVPYKEREEEKKQKLQVLYCYSVKTWGCDNQMKLMITNFQADIGL